MEIARRIEPVAWERCKVVERAERDLLRAGYDTPNGTFEVNRMDADHLSQEWDNAPMPHTMFFDMHGHAIHGFFTSNISDRRYRMAACGWRRPMRRHFSRWCRVKA